VQPPFNVPVAPVPVRLAVIFKVPLVALAMNVPEAFA
jgi:hypothetical protein